MHKSLDYELDNFNQDRELGGLMDAMDHYDLKKGLIITFDQEDQFRKEGKQIHILPAWKWLS